MKSLRKTWIHIVLTGLLSCPAVLAAEKATPEDQITALRDSARKEVFDGILPFWLKNCIDPAGGFYGRVSIAGKPIADAPKGLVLNSRILWTFSAAYNLTGNPVYLKTATRAYEYLTLRDEKFRPRAIESYQTFAQSYTSDPRTRDAMVSLYFLKATSPGAARAAYREAAASGRQDTMLLRLGELLEAADSSADALLAYEEAAHLGGDLQERPALLLDAAAPARTPLLPVRNEHHHQNHQPGDHLRG